MRILLAANGIYQSDESGYSDWLRSQGNVVEPINHEVSRIDGLQNHPQLVKHILNELWDSYCSECE
jgi:hypothetical protein